MFCKDKSWRQDVMEAFLGLTDVGECFRCAKQLPLVECDSRRLDSDNGYMLCAWCAEEYHEHWDEMWNEYWSGRL